MIASVLTRSDMQQSGQGKFPSPPHPRLCRTLRPVRSRGSRRDSEFLESRSSRSAADTRAVTHPHCCDPRSRGPRAIGGMSFDFSGMTTLWWRSSPMWCARGSRLRALPSTPPRDTHAVLKCASARRRSMQHAQARGVMPPKPLVRAASQRGIRVQAMRRKLKWRGRRRRSAFRPRPS